MDCLQQNYDEQYVFTSPLSISNYDLNFRLKLGFKNLMRLTAHRQTDLSLCNTKRVWLLRKIFNALYYFIIPEYIFHQNWQ